MSFAFVNLRFGKCIHCENEDILYNQKKLWQQITSNIINQQIRIE